MTGRGCLDRFGGGGTGWHVYAFVGWGGAGPRCLSSLWLFGFGLRLPRVWLFGCGRDGRMFRRVLSGCVGPVAWCRDRSGLVRLGAEEEEGG